MLKEHYSPWQGRSYSERLAGLCWLNCIAFTLLTLGCRLSRTFFRILVGFHLWVCHQLERSSGLGWSSLTHPGDQIWRLSLFKLELVAPSSPLHALYWRVSNRAAHFLSQLCHSLVSLEERPLALGSAIYILKRVWDYLWSFLSSSSCRSMRRYFQIIVRLQLSVTIATRSMALTLNIEPTAVGSTVPESSDLTLAIGPAVCKKCWGHSDLISAQSTWAGRTWLWSGFFAFVLINV